VNVEFVASVAPITADPGASRRLYVDTVGLPLEGDDYIHSENVPGSRHFGVWPLAQAAQACFGTSEWPADRPAPQASIEFDVATRMPSAPPRRNCARPATRSCTQPEPSHGARPSCARSDRKIAVGSRQPWGSGGLW